MKKLLCFITAFLCIFCINTISFASGSYSIPSAVFDVLIKEDGDAEVTENWTVNFESGSFTRFYKDIYNNVTKGEKFSSIDFDNAYIDGQLATRVYNGDDRNNYTYYLEYADDYYRINFYKASYGANTYTYKINYTIHDVIKRNENSKAVFAYRYVGENFDENIKSIEINIEAPFCDSINLDYSNKIDDYNINGNKITIHSHGSGLAKYAVTMPIKSFVNANDLEYVSEAEFDDVEIDFEDIFFTILFVIFVILPIIVIIGLMIESTKQNKEIKKMLDENPNLPNEILNAYEASNMHPIVLTEKLFYNLNVSHIIPFEMLILIKNENADIKVDKLYIHKNIRNNSEISNEIDNVFVKTLTQSIKYTEDNENLIFDFKEFNELYKESSSKEREKIFKLIEDFSKNVKEIAKNIPALEPLNKYEKEIMLKYFKETPNLTNISYASIFENYVSHGNRPNLEQLLAVLAAKHEKLETTSKREYLIFAYAVDSLIHQYHVSESSYIGATGGCSSCSSCSSCSGCGGGGAD